MGISFYDLFKKNVNSNLIFKAVFNFLNLFLSIDETIKKVAYFDKQIPKDGVCKVCFKFLQYLKINIQTAGLTNVKSQNGYLFFGNHPMILDPISIIVLLKLDHIKLVATEYALKIAPNFAKHIFPIKNQQTVNGKKRKRHPWDNWPLLFFLGSSIGYCEREKAIAFNQKQIEKAAQFLSQGGKLLIFPGGYGCSLEKENWKNGIGFLLNKAIKESDGKNIKFVPFYIKVNHPNLFQLKALFRFRKPSSLNIYFGKEIDVSIFGNLISNPKRLTQKISEEYRNFVKSLK